MQLVEDNSEHQQAHVHSSFTAVHTVDDSDDSDDMNLSAIFWNDRVAGQTVPEVSAVTPVSRIPDERGGNQGTNIFRWVRGEFIGKGVYGRVYLASNVTTGETLVVKQVQIPRTASERGDARQANIVAALKLENETLKDLDHPNIVRCFGFEETSEFMNLFMEYFSRETISDKLGKYGLFDDDVIRSFTREILHGLEYIHSKGILHRDITSSNILVDQMGVCKIGDFGISKRTENANERYVMTAVRGTVFWMAPEVANPGTRGYNCKVDIWSLGCVVLEMWTGERPWHEHEAMSVIVKLYTNKQVPPIPRNVTLGTIAEDFRRKCFAINPDERPSATELKNHSYLELPQDWVYTGFAQ